MIPPRAFVLAAGFGTRLRPLSEELPKPAWPLFDRPIVAHVLQGLAEVGVPEVVINLHHRPEALRDALIPHLPGALNVQWSLETEILGTGGALRPWSDWLGRGPAFVLNGDTYIEVDLVAMAAFHQQKTHAATLALHSLPEGSEAPIEVDKEGRIVRFLHARVPGAVEGAPCDFAGIHLLEPPVFQAVGRQESSRFCINETVHATLIGKGVPYNGFLVSGDTYWSDLGTPSRYLGGHHDLLVRKEGPPEGAGRWVEIDGVAEGGGRVIAPCYLGPAARVERGGVIGPNTVLGRGATVGSQGKVRESVVWPDAHVNEKIRLSIVSASGVVMNADGRSRVLLPSSKEKE